MRDFYVSLTLVLTVFPMTSYAVSGAYEMLTGKALLSNNNNNNNDVNSNHIVEDNDRRILEYANQNAFIVDQFENDILDQQRTVHNYN